MSVGGIEIVVHQSTAVCLQAIPDHQQGLLQVILERLEEGHDFFLLDAALVQPEHAVAARQTGDDRDVIPVEVELNDRGLALRRPSAHARGSFAEAGFVDKHDQTALALGFFLSAGHVRCFQ